MDVLRTKDNLIFTNRIVDKLIAKHARIWNNKLLEKYIDSGKDIDDLKGDMWVLWCECCIANSDKNNDDIYQYFEQSSVWKLQNYIKDYFNKIEGKKTTPGPEPFDPDFYDFVDLYRSGYTIKRLSGHYGVSERTIKTYIQDNFVTKKPIDPKDYLEAHEKIYGKDAAYWNIRSELITEFDVD